MLRSTQSPSGLSRGNDKLGRAIYHWSISPGEAHTCPGATTLCEMHCYAKRGRMAMMQGKYAANTKRAKSRGFAAWMIRQVADKVPYSGVVRIHASGDMFSAEYVRGWHTVALRFPAITFYTYSRSWRVPAIREELLKFAALPNVRVWYSGDAEASPILSRAELQTGVRVAYMLTPAEAEPCGKPHLVFRVSRKTPQKYVAGILVCPAENGVDGTHKHTCQTCKLCWIREGENSVHLQVPKGVSSAGRRGRRTNRGKNNKRRGKNMPLRDRRNGRATGRHKVGAAN